ncbi:MAG: macro domain-containing protein [Longimicrobiales bacterium]
MISIQIADLELVHAQALFRAVRWDLQPLTPGGRRVGLGAGEAIVERLEQMGEFPVGGAVVTPAGELAADFIIHLVIESMEEPVTETGVRKALTNGLRQACAWGVESVAIPALGTGAGCLDAETSARVILPVLKAFVGSGESLREAIVVVTNEYDKAAFEGAVELDRRQAVDGADADSGT